MPCEDLFGWWTLRCGVWLVFLLALLGNGVVVIVLIFGRNKIDVPRFLVCNLALADFFMGIYLGFLAVVDASTLGEFKAYAILWQTSWGCQMAGFFGVLSSELSVYTLSVITLERNYAITHAMHLNKRLSLKHAAYIMSVGWIFALFMALLPLFGVSDYRKFAVCLPFEIEDSKWSLWYVIFLILINGVAFLILMGCYLRMYCAIRGSQAWNSNDTRIAKRMALLVFTDFLCWAPIAFFSLTAVSGFHLISLEEAKVFTIFVLPLNSCCNPFLYAIFTKQFKKDCVMLCKRLEESRVTRGIGRGRNSSNFSNRHTPVNTNSAVDKRSGTASGSDQQSAPACPCKAGTEGHSHYILPKSQVAEKKQHRRSRLKDMASKFFWLSKSEVVRVDSNESGSIRSSQLTSGATIPVRHASLSSDTQYSSRSDSLKQAQFPLKNIGEPIHSKRPVGLYRNARMAAVRKHSHDSSLTSSTFRTSTTRSSVSSDTSCAKGFSSGTDSTTLSSNNTSLTHKPLIHSVSGGSARFSDSKSLRQALEKRPFLCPECSHHEERIQRVIPSFEKDRGKQRESGTSAWNNEEDNSNFSSSKDDPLAAASSSGHQSSAGDTNRLDANSSQETAETSLTSSHHHERKQQETTTRIITSESTANDDSFSDVKDDVFLCTTREDSSPSPSSISMRTQVPALRTSLITDLHHSSDQINLHPDHPLEPSSHSFSLLDVRSRPTAPRDVFRSGRKVTSETSLKARSWRSIPSILLRSISNIPASTSQLFHSTEHRRGKTKKTIGASRNTKMEGTSGPLLSID